MPETAKANRIHPDQEALYVSKGGAYCPFCKSDQIVGGNIDIDGNAAFQPVTCSDCGEEWQDSYTLTGCTTEYN